eukprot:g19590.t1
MDKFKPDDQQYRREFIADLNNMTMKEGADPEIFLAEVQDLANKLHYLGEGVSDARLADIVLQGLPPLYDELHLMADMDSGFTFAKIEQTTRNMGDLYFGDDSDSDSDSSIDSGDDGDTEGSDAEMDTDLIEPDGCERRPPDGKDRQLRSKGPLTDTTSRDLSAKQRRALRQLALTVSSNATSPFVPPASIPTRNTFKQAIQSPFRANQRTLLCIAASKELHVERLDVKTAFLNAPVEENVWVYQAPGFEENDPATGKTQGHGYIKVSQGNYVKSILRKFDFHESNPAPTPGTGRPLAWKPNGAVYLDKSGTKKYQEQAGTLMYMVNTTRWDIAHAVLGLTKGMAAPTEEHLVAAKKGSSLPRGTPDLPTVYHKGPLELVGFNDSVFAGELESRLSCTGFFFMLGRGVISSASVLQKTIAQSTTEAELIALNGASQEEGIYLLNRLRELGVDIDKFKLFSDAMTVNRTPGAGGALGVALREGCGIGSVALS